MTEYLKVKGYELAEKYACFNASRLNDIYVVIHSKDEWISCYNLHYDGYWLVKSYKSKQELIDDSDNFNEAVERERVLHERSYLHTAILKIFKKELMK